VGRLDGKVAVVTGAGSGIGRASAIVFAQEGARVVCADRSRQEAETARTIGGSAVGMQVDVSVAADAERKVETAESTFGPLDVLFNNAGFGGPMASLAEQSEETWDAVHAVNLKGVFLGMKYGDPRHAAQWRRVGHQHRVCGRPLGDERSQRVQRCKGGRHPTHQDRGAREREGEHPRERHLPGHDEQARAAR